MGKVDLGHAEFYPPYAPQLDKAKVHFRWYQRDFANDNIRKPMDAMKDKWKGRIRIEPWTGIFIIIGCHGFVGIFVDILIFI